MPKALPVLLHVEDNHHDAHLLGEALREIGAPHRYMVAENAIQAYNHLRLMSAGFAPALVIVDLNLPLIHGHTVLRELRRHIPWSQTAMIVLTSSQASSDHEASVRLGAVESLVKPASFEGYLDLARHLSRYLVPPPAGRRVELTSRDRDRLARPDEERRAIG